MSVAYKDAISLLLSLENSSAAAAAYTTGSDRAKRQKPERPSTTSSLNLHEQRFFPCESLVKHGGKFPLGVQTKNTNRSDDAGLHGFCCATTRQLRGTQRE